MRNLKKILKIIVFIAIYYPIIDLGIFYSFVLRAITKLNRLPTYNNPDPKDLGFNKHYEFVYTNYFEFIPITSLIVIIYLIICLIKKRNLLQLDKKHFVMFFILIIIEFLTIYLFGGWFVD